MSKVIEMSSKERAPNVREKLAAAERELSELEGQIAQIALDEAEGASGAAARMATLNSKIVAANGNVAKLSQAHRLAVDLDRRSDVASRSALRTSQFGAFQNYSGERETSVAEICGAAKLMAEAFQRYCVATQRMLGVTPAGCHVPAMGLGPNGVFESALGNLERLISAELLRCSRPDADGQRFKIPFAKPATLHSNDVDDMPPGTEIFREGQAAIIAEIKSQIEQLEAKEMAEIGAFREAV